jgi:DNA-binding ferritin-like protein
MSDTHLRRPDDDDIRREWDTMAGNELGIDPDAAAEVVGALNRNLSGLYVLFNQLRKHYWTIEGAESGDVESFLKGATDRMAEATDDLALRVHALGGVPVNGPMGIRQHALLRIEESDVYDARSALGNDLACYAELAVSLREAIELADDLGDETTVELLRGTLLEIEEDANRIEKYLADDSLATRAPER